MNQKIVLINPPNPPGAISNKDMMGGFGQLYPKGSTVRIPPIDLAYAAAILKNMKTAVSVFDCLGLNLDISSLIAQLRKEQISFIGIRTSTPTYEWDVEVAKAIKKEIGSKIIFFGSHVKVYAEEVILSPWIDAIIIGEAEAVFGKIAVKGIESTQAVWFKKNGNIVRNEGEGFVDDLDSLPFPAWELFPFQEYTIGAQIREIKPFVPILASRGCPFKCGYCPYPVAQGERWRTRSVENIVGELEYLKKELGIKAVLFRDPEFTMNRERSADIAQAMIDKKINIKWRCETRIDTLDISLVELFSRAGCIGINMGIESTNKSVLASIGRKIIPTEKVSGIIGVCEKNNIDAYVFFILGLPGETLKSTWETVQYAKKLHPKFTQFTIATPYKGTKFYENSLRLGEDLGNKNIDERNLEEIRSFAYRYLSVPMIREVLRSKKDIHKILSTVKYTILLNLQKRKIFKL